MKQRVFDGWIYELFATSFEPNAREELKELLSYNARKRKYRITKMISGGQVVALRLWIKRSG